jgi:signal transduction histidine kinase
MFYFYIGLLPALFADIFTNIILSFFFKFYALQQIAVLITVWAFACMAYAIVKYRLFDIRIIVRHGFLRLILAAFAYGTFYGATYFFQQAFGSVWVGPALITGIFIALAFAIAWPFIEKLTIKFSNKFLYTSIYATQETINNLTDKLTTIIDLKEVITLITNAMLEVMNIERAGILLKSPKSSRYLMAKVVNFDKANGISLVRDNYLTQWLEKNKKALVLEELALQYRDTADKEEKDKIRRLEKNMARIQAKLVLPLISQNKIFGLIVLGNKKSGDAYTVEDIKLLETLANQAAIAIENARLYNNMQEIVAEQTKDLKAKNIHLKKLLKMRSEFLNIASHQLRTPISVIKGNIAELLETIDKNAPKDKQYAYQAIKIKTEKLVQIIADILYSAELDTGPFDLSDRELDKIEIVPYLTKIIKDHEYEANQKNIALKLVNPPKEPIFVYASEHYLEVILDNLIINALIYTRDGGRIEIAIKPKADTVRIEVKDNGIGIPEADQKELFTKFKRARNANTMHTDGSGLGLFIVKKMIKAHPKGACGFESKLNCGSTFWIEIKRAYAKKATT